MEFISQIFDQSLIQILILILLWGLAERMGLPISKWLGLLFKFNGNGEPQWSKDLKGYFNHDLTDILKDIRDEIKRHNEAADKRHSDVLDIKRKQEEFEKYGFPVKCNYKNNDK